MYDIKNLNIWKEETNNRPSNEYLEAEIGELNLSVRSYNCLRRAGCNRIGDVVRLLEDDEKGLRRIRNLGTRSETEILQAIEQYRKLHASAQASSGRPIINRKTIRPAKNIWESDIADFHLSDYALTRLRQHGIRQVKDLYATNPKDEPGWYAVRELFEKIPLSSPR